MHYPEQLGPRFEIVPTLLFAHGFPSTSADWTRQIEYFKPKGYGLIVPDMLGYGDTAKPLETEAYAYTLLAKDLVEIVEAEAVDKVVGIGHDWSVANPLVLTLSMLNLR